MILEQFSIEYSTGGGYGQIVRHLKIDQQLE